MLKLRRLGTSDLEIAPLALGGNVFGWTADEKTSFRLLDRFVDSGFNLIDTANVYSRWKPGNRGGESETIIGKWCRQTGKRDRLLIATKVGMEMGPNRKGLSKGCIVDEAELSLRRLQTDHIDLYQSHSDDSGTPLEETLDAYAQLIRQGKVRVIGASNFSAVRLAQALQVSRERGLPAYQSLQLLYNLYERADYESGLEALCLQEHIGVICYFSLARGFLTGKYRSEADLSKSARGSGVKKYLDDRGFRILRALDLLSEQLHSAPASIALAWLMARPSIAAPIASATSLEQLDELVAAAEIDLTSEQIELLSQASAYPNSA